MKRRPKTALSCRCSEPLQCVPAYFKCEKCLKTYLCFPRRRMLKKGGRRLLDAPAVRSLYTKLHLQLARQASTLPNFLVPAWKDVPQQTDTIFRTARHFRACSPPRIDPSRVAGKQLRTQSTSISMASTSNSTLDRPRNARAVISSGSTPLERRPPHPLADATASKAPGNYTYAKSSARRSLRDTKRGLVEQIQTASRTASLDERQYQIIEILSVLYGGQHIIFGSDLSVFRPILAEALQISQSRAGSLLSDLGTMRGDNLARRFQTIRFAVQAVCWHERLDPQMEPRRVSAPDFTDQDKAELMMWIKELVMHFRACLKSAPTHSGALLFPIMIMIDRGGYFLRRNLRMRYTFNLASAADRLLRSEESRHFRRVVLQDLVSASAAAAGGQGYDESLSQIVRDVLPDLMVRKGFPKTKSAALIKTASRAGLVRTASVIFQQVRLKAAGSAAGSALNCTGSAASQSISPEGYPGPEDDLARIAASLVRDAVRVGNPDEAEAIWQGARSSSSGSAAGTSELWQRKLEAWFVQQKLAGRFSSRCDYTSKVADLPQRSIVSRLSRRSRPVTSRDAPCWRAGRCILRLRLASGHRVFPSTI